MRSKILLARPPALKLSCVLKFCTVYCRILYLESFITQSLRSELILLLLGGQTIQVSYSSDLIISLGQKISPGYSFQRSSSYYIVFLQISPQERTNTHTHTHQKQACICNIQKYMFCCSVHILTKQIFLFPPLLQALLLCQRKPCTGMPTAWENIF